MKFSQRTQSLLGAQNSIFFFGSLEIREVIYAVEGVCSETAYEDWRNTLYKATSIVHMEEQPLLTLEELEAAGQFPGEMFPRSLVGG